MATKNDKDKKPIQIEAKAKLDELKDNTDSTSSGTETPQPTKKRGPKKGSKRKPKWEPPTVEESEKEASFFLDFIHMLRKGAGIDKSLPEHQQSMFKVSFHAITVKYGESMSRFMPEILFGGSVFLICYDSLAELKIVKLKEEAEKKRKQKDAPKQDIEKDELPATLAI